MHKSVGKCGLSGALRLLVIFLFERLAFIGPKNQMLHWEKDVEMFPIARR